uniref:Protein TAPETUM DETERMINANT 1 n=1 Tax=Picea sitchensis TaxID=3332 RepID=D5AAG9_PICSI|nr:unknown [Picea sitchensis]
MLLCQMWSFIVFKRVIRGGILLLLFLVLLLQLLNFASIYSAGTPSLSDMHLKVSEIVSPEMAKTQISAGHKTRRLLRTGKCSNRDISITQYPDTSSGIPEYIVQIVNTCMHGCAPSNIHLHCGWFASAKVLNPNTFRRTAYDDCLVNAGRPLKPSQIIRFAYENSFMYPLSFKSARFC